MVNILFVGDIVGESGIVCFKNALSKIRKTEKIDFVIVNGENSSSENGISANSAKELFCSGADVITTGNHVFHHKDLYDTLNDNPMLIRPANYSPSAPGCGVAVADMLSYKIAVINLSGKAFMDGADNPFTAVEKIIPSIKDCSVKIVDFHAESTGEKGAMGYYLDGKVSAVLGTHTHVRTDDAKILPNGTAFITDVGMTGPVNSILGMNPECIVKRMSLGIPERFVHAGGKCDFSGVLLQIDTKTGNCTQILCINNI